MLVEYLPSIVDLKPIEQGGSIARNGFLYQDHVAARFCIAMLQDETLEAVWCETLDDITLLWRDDQQITVEFVQVKAAKLKQMWSIAQICDGKEQSLVARSMAQHRCSESCRFRVVSRVSVNADLEPLTKKIGESERCIGEAGVSALHAQVGKQLYGLYTPAGWSPSNWLGHTYWQVAGSELAIEHSNHMGLEAWLESIGEPLFSDQRAEFYTHILACVIRAAALAPPAYIQKRLKRSEFYAWAVAVVQRIKGHAPSKAGTNLVLKMEQALIPNSSIENALILRLEYRRRMLDPKYQQEGSLRTAELELTAKLNHLLAELDAGIINSSGKAFHLCCLNVAAQVREAFADVDLSFLQGSMYSMTDRCRHRFISADFP